MGKVIAHPQWSDKGDYIENVSGDPTRVSKLEVDNATTYIDKDESNNMTFTDAVSGTQTLADLIGGGGGDVATDTIWDAKGDLAVGTGANTAAKLTVGADNTILAVSTDTPAWETPATVAATMALDDIGVPDAAVDFDLQQATDLVVMTVADEASLPQANIAVGQICFATSELTLHICTSAS